MSDIQKQAFGETKKGEAVSLYTLENKNGIRAQITDYGATLQAMFVPDRKGELKDVVLGFDSVEGYQSDANMYFGCTIGRYANRIGKASFSLDGVDYKLEANLGENSLHGGGEGSLEKKVWDTEILNDAEAPELKFSVSSPDGEEGYPGNLNIVVTYTLNNENELIITYNATTDKKTILNLTNHSYWNLAGAGVETVLDHELYVNALEYTATDDDLIPTGEFALVADTALDFNQAKAIGKDIAEVDASPMQGYDHNYVLESAGDTRELAARLKDPSSGRVLEVRTTEPGIQVYTGNFLNGGLGKESKAYSQRSAVCLETQHYPDSIHHDNFPDVILDANEAFNSTTIHKFSVEA